MAAHAGAGAVPLVALSALAGGLWPPIAPSVRALLRDLVTDAKVRETAYALESVVQELVWITGPLVVAGVIAFASPGTAVLLSGTVSICGTLLFVSSPAALGRGSRGARQGRAPVLAIPELRTMLGPIFLNGLAIGAIGVGLPALALHAGSRPASGILLALWSVGSITGGLWYGSREWHASLTARYRALLWTGVICMAPLIAARTIPEGLVGAVLAGLVIAPVFSCQYALVGRAVPSGVETEAFTWVSSALVGGLAAGSALGGGAVGGRRGGRPVRARCRWRWGSPRCRRSACPSAPSSRPVRARLSDLAEHSAGVARAQVAGRQITEHHAARAHHRAGADGDARADDDAGRPAMRRPPRRSARPTRAGCAARRHRADGWA